MSPFVPSHGRRRAELFATERPPRLVLRFAAFLTLGLALASAVILLVVRHYAVEQAEQAATSHARVVAATLLQTATTPSDFARPVSERRRAHLDTLLRAALARDETSEVALVRGDGLITYSTHHGRIGNRSDGSLVGEAAGGFALSTVVEPEGGEKSIVTYAPVGTLGVSMLTQPYTPVDRAAHGVLLRVGAVLEALLIALILVLVPVLSRVTSRIRDQIQRIRQLALFDELTGLPNRANFREQLSAAVVAAAETERSFAVLLLDIAHFREVNDTLGHDAGDTLLCEVARRLSAAGTDGMLIARTGGDAFAILAEVERVDDVHALADLLRAVVEDPTTIEGVPLAIESYVGVALFPADGDDAETLLKRAEVALYTAKEWRSGTVLYSPAVDPHDPRQLGLVAELREAIGRGELELHFQPKIELATSTIVGFESLAYWQHPTRGLLPPGAFIPVAERTGVIRHLSRAVLDGALHQLHEWAPFGAELSVAVNLTAIDLLDLELPSQIQELLSRHAVRPSRLTLELTETMIMTDPDRARVVLERLAAIGVRLSIDDFGTGHSSLAYLKNFPVNEVKIDRSFVMGMDSSRHDRTIVRTTVELGHELGLSVVAEGVESWSVHEWLGAFSCDYAQGYHYARPAPAEAVTERLQRWVAVAA